MRVIGARTIRWDSLCEGRANGVESTSSVAVIANFCQTSFLSSRIAGEIMVKVG